MITCDSTREVVEHFRDAALGLSTWSDALARLGRVIDTPIMQLAGIATAGSLSLNHMSGVTDDMLAGYYAERGYDPAVNPRTRGLLEAAAYQCVTDAELVGHRRDEWAIYDFFDRTGASHGTLVRLHDRGCLMSGLAVMRSAAAGPHVEAELRLLQAVAPEIESIIHAAIALGTEQDRVVIETAELLSGAVVLLGGSGEIVSLSPVAAAVLADGAPLSARAGLICAPDSASDVALARAIRAASLAAGTARRESSLVLNGGAQRPSLAIQLFPLPLRLGGPLSTAQVMLTIRLPAATGRLDIRALRQAFGFTAAEAEIAALLAAGRDPSAIAAARGSSVQTVRSQLKAIYGKTGTHRQAQLAVLLRSFGDPTSA